MQKAAPKAETVTLKDLAAKLAETHEPAQGSGEHACWPRWSKT